MELGDMLPEKESKIPYKISDDDILSPSSFTVQHSTGQSGFKIMPLSPMPES